VRRQQQQLEEGYVVAEPSSGFTCRSNPAGSLSYGAASLSAENSSMPPTEEPERAQSLSTPLSLLMVC
jgi:hypothetical protein